MTELVAIAQPDARPTENMSERITPSPQTPVSLIGPKACWFSVKRDGKALVITPRQPLPRRCVIRPAALFQQQRGFPDVNTVMGKLLFASGSTSSQIYEPYTLDTNRRFRELLLLVEACPDDELFSSITRWRNYETVAKRLLSCVDMAWVGLSDRDLDELLGEEPWLLPLEGCVLHALAQAVQTTGTCVIEIGSLRGQSIAMLARGLRGTNASRALISIDPHIDQPLNRELVWLALVRTGQEQRLVQMQLCSDDAAGLLAKESAGMIFVDGDYSYGQVVADFENYAPLLCPGGLMVFHDYGYGLHNGRPDVVPDVRRALDKHVMQNPQFEPLMLAHTLMVFRKR